MFLPRSDQYLVVQRGKGAREKLFDWQRNHWQNLTVPGASYIFTVRGGGGTASNQPEVLAARLPACPPMLTNPPSLALNSLSLNSFSVSVSQSGFSWFINKEPDRSGKRTPKNFESSESE